jgi:hypothetical protein
MADCPVKLIADLEPILILVFVNYNWIAFVRFQKVKAVVLIFHKGCCQMMEK